MVRVAGRFSDPEFAELLDRLPAETRRRASKQQVAQKPVPAARRLRRLSSSQIDELVAAYQGGATQAALAERFGQHENTIGLHLRKRGVLGRGPRVLTDEQADELRRLRESEGLSYAELGRRFGVSDRTARNYVLGAWPGHRTSHRRA